MTQTAHILRMRTALYRHYDAEGNLLYVGISLSPISRTSQHAQTAEWFNDVARIDIEWHGDRKSAVDAERAAIRSEDPAFNVADRKPCAATFVPVLRAVSLDEWLTMQRRFGSAKDFADAVGISPSYLSDLRNRRRDPSLDVAFAIEDFTLGAVPARAWVSK
jgi:hypothetical protein